MFENIENKLEVDKDGAPSARDIQISTAFLMLKVGRADNSLDGCEVKSVTEALKRQFNINDAEAGDVLGVAEFLSRDSDKSEQFTDIIKNNFDQEQKMVVMTMIWKVVVADFQVEDTEVQLARAFQSQLGLSDEQGDQALAKARAAQGDLDALKI